MVIVSIQNTSWWLRIRTRRYSAPFCVDLPSFRATLTTKVLVSPRYVDGASYPRTRVKHPLSRAAFALGRATSSTLRRQKSPSDVYGLAIMMDYDVTWIEISRQRRRRSTWIRWL